MAITLRDAFADFFSNPSRESLHVLIAVLPEERDEIDFKREWDSWPKLAKHMLAMANKGNSLIVHGVEEKDGIFAAAGLPVRLDKVDISKGVQAYIPGKLSWDVWDFIYPSDHPLAGKQFQVIAVNYDSNLIPFVSQKDGENITRNRIYTRRKTESVEANYDELQDIIRRRLHSTSVSARRLAEHLEELRALYASLNRYLDMNEMVAGMLAAGKNPRYPTEDFETFVIELINEKKQTIRSML